MRTVVRAEIVSQYSIHESVGSVLKRTLDVLNYRRAEIINIFETKVSPIPGCTDQAFIILYRMEVDE